MTTADIALKMDPIYAPISKYYYENFDEFQDAFARAWFKLTHRDMGPIDCYLGAEVPTEELIWQDPKPAIDYELIDNVDIANLKNKLIQSGLSVSELVSTAWASAATFRGSDKRGGANGARIRLEPQLNWEVNNPTQLKKVLAKLDLIKKGFNDEQIGNKRVSMADIIVLGGCAAIEKAVKKAGQTIIVPFTPGRSDATLEQTDIDSFAVLEPKSDGFRNYQSATVANISAEKLLIDRAQLLKLTAAEMTVLVGGMRVLDTNYDGSNQGVFTQKTETLTNDFFVNLLNIGTTWKSISHAGNQFEGVNRVTGKVIWTATRVDLIFGSNSELRAIAEVYASSDSSEKFIKDFISAWDKVMCLDRFDLK